MGPTPFRQIGKGFCGSVWASNGDSPSIAMKREDGGPYRSVATDSAMHIEIERSLKHAQETLGLAVHVSIPQHHSLIDKHDVCWWDKRASQFPAGYQHCTTLLSERIPPLRQDARERLIDLFCAEPAKESVKKNRQDEDCLVRPYLGRRTYNAVPSRFFTLRNKPLCINQMEDIDLPVQEYARAMAEALAVIYWHSKTDANDIEFVLAPGRSNAGGFASEALGRHAMWALDFDCVRPLTHDKAGIERAALAYVRNDPFWPRPASDVQADRDIWEIFRVRFLESSALILGTSSELPQMFVSRVEFLVQQVKEKKQAVHERSDPD